MMKTEHTRHPHDGREARRRRAGDLHQQGWLRKDIAAAFGVTAGAVSHGMRRGREGGVAALYHRPRSSPAPRLTDARRQHLPILLARGAESVGFRGDRWTRQCSPP